MNKYKFAIALFTLSVVAVMIQLNLQRASANSFGAPVSNGRGYTGSPLDNRSCNTSGCHSGTLNAGPGAVEITSTIPAEGYKAGERYSITAKVTESGIQKFGFQITAENSSNQKSGRFIAGSQTRAPSDFFVTHGTSSASTAGSGTKSWTFSWDAPEEAGEGEITFYASFNAANSNGSRTGDNIYTTSLSAQENILSNLQVAEKSAAILKIYPNPAIDECSIEMELSNTSIFASLAIYSLSGRLILSKEVEVLNGKLSEKLSLGSLKKGLYLLAIQTQDKTYYERLSLR